MSKLSPAKKAVLVALGLPALLLLAIMALAYGTSKREFGCFILGQTAAEYGLGSHSALRLMSWPCASQPWTEDEFYDGAGHTFPFVEGAFAAEAARAARHVEARQPRKSFLRGMFIQFGRNHPYDLEAARRYGQGSNIIPEHDRIFGLVNGMAWGLGPDLKQAVKAGLRASGQMRDIFFEELGWQVGERAFIAGAPLEFSLVTSLVPEQQLCFSIHGLVRYMVMHGGQRSREAALVRQAPAQCRDFALRGALRARQIMERAAAGPPPESLRQLLGGGKMKQLKRYDYLP